MQLCASCQTPIIDRYLLNVLDRAWHVQCVQCSDCACALTDKCFSRDGKLFCRNDFFRRFGTKCAGCSQGISPNDLVRKAQNKVFHLKCFTCMICRKQLSTGEELYIVGENKFLCKQDYIQHKLEGSDGEDEMDFDSTLDSQDGVSEKDVFGDDKHCQLKDHGLTEINHNDAGIKAEHLLNNSEVYSTKLNGTCTSPLKMDHGVLTEQLTSIKHENGLTSNGLGDAIPPSPTSPDINMNGSAISGPGSDESVDINDNISCGDANDNDGDGNDANSNHSGPGSKRRGPRTTIKAKQLEVLKAAFNATPKPTRHIREQLASETGLNMRVIQVWFQNRRSKERRMKQLSALGARRHFFRGGRRRSLRGDLDDPDMMGPAFYYNEAEPDMYGNFGPAYNNFYPGGPGPDIGPGNMNYMVPNSRGTPPHMDPAMMASRGMVGDGGYLGGDMLPPSSSPDTLHAMADDQYLQSGNLRMMTGPPPFSAPSALQSFAPPRQDMPSEVW